MEQIPDQMVEMSSHTAMSSPRTKSEMTLLTKTFGYLLVVIMSLVVGFVIGYALGRNSVKEPRETGMNSAVYFQTS